jgi:protein SCO1/2
MASITPRVAAIAAATVIAVGLGVGGWLALSPGDGLAQCREGGGTVGADIGGPFELTDPEGRARRAAEIVDRPTLVYFGYTHCPDFCPTDAATMAAAHDILAERGIDANMVFVTIDPARDDRAALAAFRDAIHPEMIALTGDDDAIAEAARAYRVYYAKAGDDPEFYLMDHTTFTYLMHPETGFLDFFRHGADPADIADRVGCYVEALG